MSEKKAKKDYLSILQSTSNVQEKTNLRQRTENTIYVESSDFDIDDISDEGMSFKYKHFGFHTGSQKGECC